MATNSVISGGKVKQGKGLEEGLQQAGRQRVILEAVIKEGIAARRQILEPNCLIQRLVLPPSLVLWPRASYLTRLQLGFLIPRKGK